MNDRALRSRNAGIARAMRRQASIRECKVCHRKNAIKTDKIPSFEHELLYIGNVKTCRWCGYKVERNYETNTETVLNPGKARVAP